MSDAPTDHRTLPPETGVSSGDPVPDLVETAADLDELEEGAEDESTAE